MRIALSSQTYMCATRVNNSLPLSHEIVQGTFLPSSLSRYMLLFTPRLNVTYVNVKGRG